MTWSHLKAYVTYDMCNGTAYFDTNLIIKTEIKLFLY